MLMLFLKWWEAHKHTLGSMEYQVCHFNATEHEVIIFIETRNVEGTLATYLIRIYKSPWQAKTSSRPWEHEFLSPRKPNTMITGGDYLETKVIIMVLE